MRNLPLSLNPYQTALSILSPKYNYIVAGRGLGKSTLFGAQLHKIAKHLPGAAGVIVAKTFNCSFKEISIFISSL